MTHFLSIQRILGVLLMVFSLTMLPPVGIDLWYRENSSAPFLHSFGIAFSAGLAAWFVARKHHANLHLKEAFLIIVLMWIVISGAGALPLYLLEIPRLSLHEAVFESIAGLTTTGATVMTGLDSLPHAVLLYRHLLQWFGGLGIILIAIAITPILGIGGMQLYRTEAMSAGMGGKVLPRFKDVAHLLWRIYLFLTAACAVAYRLAGMSWFDAVCHSFSTVAIGGFSTHDASFGYFLDKPAVLLVAVVFMILAATSFGLHFFAWRRRSLLAYWKNAEFKVFIVLLAVMALLTAAALAAAGRYDGLVQGLFHAVSITTTTGFVAAPAQAFPAVVPMLLLFASFVGGCAGSTAGGMKVIRFWMLLKQGFREMRQLIHPDAIAPLKVGNKVLDNKTVQSVWGFFSAYVGSLILVTLLLMATGLDQESAFSAAAAAINNLGPGLGQVADNYASVSTPGKWILCFSMLLGRLEVFALLIVLTPMFWRK